MKKILLTLLVAATAYNMQAQNINASGDHPQVNVDIPHIPTYVDTLSGWSVEGNVMLGLVNQVYTGNSLLAAYITPVNSGASSIQFHTGVSFGMEGQAAYFFGKKRHWGVGMGFNYFVQKADVTMDKLHAEYAAYDNYNSIYRQVVTTKGQVKENLTMYNFNVPLVAKYQTRFTKRIGFTADAGLLLNLYTQNNYKTNASFDYEAVYKYVGNEGAITTAYETAVNPPSSDLVITKDRYLGTNTAGDVQSYFNSMRAQGYNVALDTKPRDNTGSVTYKSGSLGFIVRPAVSIYLNNNLMLDVGVYYTYQALSNVPVSNYMITDRIGEYSSVLNTVKKAETHSYGINVGVRYNFKKRAPKKDPVVATTVEVDEVEEVASPIVIEEETPPANIDISTPLLFDLNKITIKQSSMPILEEAARELKDNPNAKLIIHGYTDNTGTKDYNKKLSNKRAAVVKDYLRRKGVNPKLLKTVGHGEGNPAESNKTKEGRMRNRRVIMRKDDE